MKSRIVARSADATTRDCAFCQVAGGARRADIIHEDDLVIAFPDIHPIRPGHTQIISRSHFPCFDDLPEEVSARIIHVGQRLARVMKEAYGVIRVAFVFTGGDLPHAHAHVVPMHEHTDITSTHYIAERKLTFRAAPRASDDDLAASAAMLRSALNRHRRGAPQAGDQDEGRPQTEQW